MDDAEMQNDPQLEQEGGESYTKIEGSPLVPRRDRLGYNPQVHCGYDAGLEYDRLHNTDKLRHRFESIFEKYGRDFEGIGDEIDVETGRIVIDNGHIANMRHEADPGDNAASEFVHAFTNNLGQEGHVSSSEESDVSVEHGTRRVEQAVIEISSDDGSDSDEASSGDFSTQDQTADSATSFFEPDDSPQDIKQEDAQASSTTIDIHTTGSIDPELRDPHSIIESLNQSGGSSSHPMPSALFDQMPDLKNSMLVMQTNYQQGQAMDENTIQALGMSIANQLASMVSSGQSGRPNMQHGSARNRTWQYPELPKDYLPKRKVRSPSPRLPRQPTAPSPTRQSLWAPVRHPRPRKRVRLRVAPSIGTANPDEDGSLSYSDDGQAEQSMESRQHDSRVCYNCDCSSTRTWRTGPDGDLCNTCGMYFYRYGLLRPTGDASENDESSTNDCEDEMDPLELDSMGQQYFPHGASEPKTTSVKNTHFTLEEDVLLLKLKEVDSTSWETCALQFPGRSAFALQCRYSKKLHGRQCEARDHLVEEGYRIKENSNGTVMFDYRRDKFSEEEDDLLLTLRDDGLEWDAIEPSFQGRSAEHLERRYHDLAGQYLDEASGALKSSNKGTDRCTRLCSRYSAEEDELMIKLREAERMGWSEIAQRMPGRNAMSLQKRYIRELAGKHHISDLASLNDGAGDFEDASNGDVSLKNMMYSPAEDELLLWFKNEEQLEWAEIREKMPGRDTQSLMNRYLYIRMKGGLSHVQKGMRRINVTEGIRLVTNEAHVENGRVQLTSNDWSRPPVCNTLGTIDPQLQYMTAIDTAMHQDSSTERHQAQLNMSNKLHGFSQVEDGLIVKLHELEHLPWTEIAARIPGHEVSSISERYFQHLRHRAAFPYPRLQSRLEMPPKPTARPLTREAANVSIPSVTKRWSHEDSELIRKLREEGIAWEDIATRLPGRSTKAIENHHWVKYGKKLRETLPASASSVAALKSKPDLLRKAVGNNLRRHSESTVPHTTPNAIATADSLIDRRADCSVIRTHYGPPRRPANWRTPSPEASPMPWDPSERSKKSTTVATTIEVDLPTPDEPGATSRGQIHKPVPETATPTERKPLTPPAQDQSPAPEMVVLAKGRLSTPPVESRSPMLGSMQLDLPMTAGSDSSSKLQPLFPETPLRHYPVDTGSEPSTELRICYTTPARYNAQAMPYYAAPPAIMYSPLQDEAPMTPDNSVPKLEQNAESVKKARQPIKSQPIRSQPIKPQPARVRATQSEGKDTRAALDIADNASEESEEILYEATDTDDTESDSEVEGVNEPIDDTDHEYLPNSKPPAVEARGDVDLTERPTLSMVVLVANALNSKAPEPMSSKHVCEYIQTEYPFYKTDKSSWRDAVRGTLSGRPQFRKATNDFKALWALSGVDLPTALRDDDGRLHANGRRKRGRPRKHPLPALKSSSPLDPSKLRACRGHTKTTDAEVSAVESTKILDHTSQVDVSRTSDNDVDAASAGASNEIDEISFEISQDPESSTPAATASDAIVSEKDSSLTSIGKGDVSSSSPILTKRRTLRSTYGRILTPFKSQSTLTEQCREGSVPHVKSESSHPRISGLRNASSVTDLASGRRILATPVRDCDDSEDELAL